MSIPACVIPAITTTMDTRITVNVLRMLPVFKQIAPRLDCTSTMEPITPDIPAVTGATTTDSPETGMSDRRFYYVSWFWLWLCRRLRGYSPQSRG
jgi:hypothetical protein